MQIVFVCGGKGQRLQPRSVHAKSLMQIAGSSLLARLVAQFAPLHRSSKPPLVIVAAGDDETPRVASALLPGAHVVAQAQPDGVANVLLMVQPLLDEYVIVTLGDLFLDGSFAAFGAWPSLTHWPDGSEADTRHNFGIVANGAVVTRVVEKPHDSRSMQCGVGVYVLNHEAISCFRAAPVNACSGERGITDGLQAAIDAGITFRVIPFSGYYRNVNSLGDVAAIEQRLARPVR